MLSGILGALFARMRKVSVFVVSTFSACFPVLLLRASRHKVVRCVVQSLARNVARTVARNVASISTFSALFLRFLTFS